MRPLYNPNIYFMFFRLKKYLFPEFGYQAYLDQEHLSPQITLTGLASLCLQAAKYFAYGFLCV